MDLKKKAKSGTKPYERAKLAELESGGPNNGRGGKNSGFGPEKDRKSYIRRQIQIEVLHGVEEGVTFFLASRCVSFFLVSFNSYNNYII